MSFNAFGGIESGNLRIRVLTTNTASMTLLTEEKFDGKVIQPEAKANRIVGEHGLSISIEVRGGEDSQLFLMDTGGLAQAIIPNSKQLGVDLNEVNKLILTHGHLDHWGGLPAVMPLLKEESELILNPLVYEQNFIAIPKRGKEVPAEELGQNLKKLVKEDRFKLNKKLPQLNKGLISRLAEEHKINIIQTKEPIELYPGITTSGEIELSDKEEATKGFYIQKSRKKFLKHNFRDETAIYINVKNKGLVVLTGCGHCGIVNIIKHGQKLTGINDIYAVIGGFHEEWNPIEKVKKKVQYFKEMNPEILCGMHCTGFIFNKLMSDHPAHTLGVTGTEFRL
jgi:7,8-dihydropterin-6-yl-methyl-4-(beta-D-ribofuranosyl)aminobenzene 5'-phosphate synthase